MLHLLGALLISLGAIAVANLALIQIAKNRKHARRHRQIEEIISEIQNDGELYSETSDDLSDSIRFIKSLRYYSNYNEYEYSIELHDLLNSSTIPKFIRSKVLRLVSLMSQSRYDNSSSTSTNLAASFSSTVLLTSGLIILLADSEALLNRSDPKIVEQADGKATMQPVSEDFAVQRVFFGTDRAVESKDGDGLKLGFKRADELTVGIADVTIPSAVHRVGQVELPRDLTVLTFSLWQEDEAPARHFTIQRIEELGQIELQALAAEAVSEARSYPSMAFVFIHGFNTSFRDSVFRTAQLAWDLRFDGPAFLYSWPSVGHTEDYVTDIDAAAEAAPYMDDFFELVLTTPGIERVHIIAHSMGNAALAELFQKAGTRLSKREDRPFDEIILASPDLNVRGFRQVSEHFKRFAEDITLYASSTDRALLASKKIRSDFVRLGDVGEYGPAIVPGVYSIDVSSEGTDIFALNHNIYVTSKLILADLGQLFRFGKHPPDLRSPAFLPRDGVDGRFWYVPY